MREASGRGMDGKTALSLSSQMGCGEGGTEKARLGWLPAALLAHRESNAGKLAPTGPSGTPVVTVKQGHRGGPPVSTLPLGLTLPSGAVAVWCRGAALRGGDVTSEYRPKVTGIL